MERQNGIQQGCYFLKRRQSTKASSSVELRCSIVGGLYDICLHLKYACINNDNVAFGLYDYFVNTQRILSAQILNVRRTAVLE